MTHNLKQSPLLGTRGIINLCPPPRQICRPELLRASTTKSFNPYYIDFVPSLTEFAIQHKHLQERTSNSKDIRVFPLWMCVRVYSNAASSTDGLKTALTHADRFPVKPAHSGFCENIIETLRRYFKVLFHEFLAELRATSRVRVSKRPPE